MHQTEKGLPLGRRHEKEEEASKEGAFRTHFTTNIIRWRERERERERAKEGGPFRPQ